MLSFFGTIEDLKELVRAAYPNGDWLKGFFEIYDFREESGKGRLMWHSETGEVTLTGRGRSKMNFERILTMLLEEYAQEKPVRSSDNRRRTRMGTTRSNN
jgi:hypothetical protein